MRHSIAHGCCQSGLPVGAALERLSLLLPIEWYSLCKATSAVEGVHVLRHHVGRPARQRSRGWRCARLRRWAPGCWTAMTPRPPPACVPWSGPCTSSWTGLRFQMQCRGAVCSCAFHVKWSVIKKSFDMTTIFPLVQALLAVGLLCGGDYDNQHGASGVTSAAAFPAMCKLMAQVDADTDP